MSSKHDKSQPSQTSPDRAGDDVASLRAALRDANSTIASLTSEVDRVRGDYEHTVERLNTEGAELRALIQEAARRQAPAAADGLGLVPMLPASADQGQSLPRPPSYSEVRAAGYEHAHALSIVREQQQLASSGAAPYHNMRGAKRQTAGGRKSSRGFRTTVIARHTQS